MPRATAIVGCALWIGAVSLCAGCGDDTGCDHSDQCPAGSYCAAGECQSDCTPGTNSCAGGVCTRYGRCAIDTPDPDAGVCAAKVLEAEFGIPTVMLLIDQSTSMNAQYPEPDPVDTRWNVLRDALIDPATGVVSRFESSIRFGLTLYTNDGTGTCPDLTVVDPALDNRAAILSPYNAARPGGFTPTGDSILAIVPTLGAFAEPGPKYIILATDGEPNTCAQPQPNEGQPEAIAAAQAAFDAGITLFILSVGRDVREEHLQAMANAGAGYPVDGTQTATFYVATDATKLAAAFDDITGRVLTCDLQVNGTIDANAIQSGVIYLDGTQLSLDDADGWEAVDETTFRLLGAACTSAQRQGSHTVTAQFGCDDVDPTELHTSGGGAIGRGCSGLGESGLAALAGTLIAGAWVSRRRRRRKETTS